MEMQTIFINIFSQLVYLIGVVFLVGFLMHFLNKKLYNLIGHKRWVCYATGFIGTPIHELSHALMCLMFFHKIKEIKLFQMDNQSGTMGYVTHSHNPKNIYQVIGNYFIGTAPMFVGSLIIFLMIKFMFSNLSYELVECFNSIAMTQSDGDIVGMARGYWNAFFGMFTGIISEAKTGVKWVIFMLIAMCISIHMKLSGADIKGALKSLPFLVGIVSVFNLSLGLISFQTYLKAVDFINIICAYFSSFLILSLAFSILTFIIFWILWMVKRIIFR